MVTDAVNWKSLTYDFQMAALAEVELLCEFRASKGRAKFALNSLRLIRKRASPPASAAGNTKVP
jgi:hypothetical protein